MACRVAPRVVPAVPVIGFLYVAQVVNDKILNVLDKSRIPRLGIGTATLEDEKLLGRCRPEPFDRLRTGSARGLRRSAPNRRAPSRPLWTAVVLSVGMGAPGDGTSAFC